jgi:ketosteroid isomerase-like protein
MEVVVTGFPPEPQRPGRRLGEHLMVRFPWAWRAASEVGRRALRPRSRVRRAWLRRNVASAYAAASRRDFDLMLVRYARDVEVDFDPDFEALGLGGTFRGHDGLLKMIATFGEAWEHWDLQPEMVMDFGDSFLGLGRFRLPGTASGLGFAAEFAQLLTVRGGVVAREREFLSWEKGLRAAGLSSEEVAAVMGSVHPRSPSPPAVLELRGALPGGERS